MPNYGDLIHAVGAAFIVAYQIWRIFFCNELDLPNVLVTCFVLIGGVLRGLSYYQNSLRLSFVAGVLTPFFFFYLAHVGCPFPCRDMIVPIFATALVQASFNTEVSSFQKEIVATLSFFFCALNAYLSADTSLFEQAPLLLIILGIFVLYNSFWKDLMNPNRAAALVTVWVVLDVGVEVLAIAEDPEYTRTGLNRMIRAALIGGFAFLWLQTLKVTMADLRRMTQRVTEEETNRRKALMRTVETISHELRTPLQGILGVCSLLLEDKAITGDIREMIVTMMAAGRLQLTLVNNILDIRKCEANEMNSFILKPMLISRTLKDVIAVCQPIASTTKSTIAIDATCEEEELWVEADSVRLQQLLMNIVSNALKYSPERSTVRISSKRADFVEVNRFMDESLKVANPLRLAGTHDDSHRQCCVVSVSDSGQGIPESQCGKLFMKFQQLDNNPSTKVGRQIAQPSGTGLGLALCAEFIERMNGNIWVSNDNGAVFSFYLPLISKPSQTRLITIQPSKPEKTTQTQRRALLVDDSTINLKVIGRMISNSGGVDSVTTASSGKEALKILSQESFDIIFTDYEMPEMNGDEFVSRFLGAGVDKRPFIVCITAETSESVADLCREVGIDRILHKPITAKQMREFLTTTFAKSKSE